MRAARAFVQLLTPQLSLCTRIKVELFGSLALTGRGHATDRAIILGLCGYEPATIEPTEIERILADVRANGYLSVLDKAIPFAESTDLEFKKRESLPTHPNGMQFSAFDNNELIAQATFFSIGGGAIVQEGAASCEDLSVHPTPAFPFSTAAELLSIARNRCLAIADVVRANERAWRPEERTQDFLQAIHKTMHESIARGCFVDGILPGGLGVRRRAPSMNEALQRESSSTDPYPCNGPGRPVRPSR